MAASQPSTMTPSTSGTPVAATAAGAGADPQSSASASASAAPSAPASERASAANGNSQNGTPQPQQAAAATKTLPRRDKELFNKLQVEEFLVRDSHNAAARWNQTQNSAHHQYRLRNKVSDYRQVRETFKHQFPPNRVYGQGYNGYGNGITDIHPKGPQPQPAKLLYPGQKPKPASRKTAPLKWKRKDMKKQAEQHEDLVPVRIDVDLDKIRLRDTFTWNLHDRIVGLDLFLYHFLEDLGVEPIPANQAVYDAVATQAHGQLMDYYPFAYLEEDALDPELPYSAYKNDEMRVLIKLNITIGQHTLIDQFEWDMNNPLNSPEDFAACMARDMALSGEYTTAIAHSIREQCQLFTRGLYSVGHPFDGRPVEDPDLLEAMLPSPLPVVFRPQQQAKEYAPYLYELSGADVERNEMVFSREQRRQKRSINRRGGPQLPDLKERQRTIRTLVLSSVLPGAATNTEDSTLYKRVIGAPTTRRRGGRDGEFSDSDDSDDSGPDSPAVSQLGGGTARTRGLRGAASAAQQRMANLGRSETPEAGVIHHHETRRNAGRHGRDLRDETEEPSSMIIILRVSRDKLRRVLQNPRARATPAGSQTPGTPAHTRAPSASVGASSMPPPTTPASNTQSLPPKTGTPALLGGVPASAPVEGQGQPQPPPPPEWLMKNLQQLAERYPHDKFEGTMRYSCINPETDSPITLPQGLAQFQAPPGHRWMFLPRIRCKDCPGKSYTPGPEMTTDNFERHLKMSSHRKNVDTRCGFDTKPKVAARPSAEGTPGL